MFKDKIKALVKTKTEGNNKKNIENLVVFLVLLIVTVIAINTIWGKEETSVEENTSNSYKTLAENLDKNITSNNNEVTEYNLQDELEDILAKIDGVRKGTSTYYIFRNKSSSCYV